jgi:hypothetical protein
LIAASQSGKAIEVTYRAYIAGSELDGPENDPPIVFSLVDVSAGGTQVSVDAGDADGRGAAVPL